MYRAMDVARHVINYSNKNGYEISNIRLQKVLYFTQAYFIIKRNELCFSDDLYAWQYGPVIPEVYYEFRGWGSMSIPTITRVTAKGYKIRTIQYIDSVIFDEDKILIDHVTDETSNMTVHELIRISHNQPPWRRSYSYGRKRLIPKEYMKEYFGNHEKTE